MIIRQKKSPIKLITGLILNFKGQNETMLHQQCLRRYTHHFLEGIVHR